MNDPKAEPKPRTSSSLISNSGWNLTAFSFGLAANFVTLPLVIRWIGLETFGVAGLVLAVCAPLMLIGTVLGQAVVCEMSSQLGRGQDDVARRTLDAALRLCLMASGVGWLILVLAGPWITGLLTGDEAGSPKLMTAFVIAATGWLAQQTVLVLQGSCAAHQDFRTMAKGAGFTAATGIVVTLAITWTLPTLEGYLLGVSVGFALGLAFWIVELRNAIQWRTLLCGERKTETAALLHFGKWQSIAQLAGAFGNQIDRYVLGALAPVSVVGQYNVANRLQEAAYIGVVKGGEVLFPRFGNQSSLSEQERCRFFQNVSWVLGTFSAMLLAPLVPLSGAILTLWIGSEAADGGAQILRTLVLGGIVGAGSNVFSYYAMGIGRNAPVAFISVLYSSATVLLTILLIKIYGSTAAGAGLLAASVLRVSAGLVITRRSLFTKLSWGELAVSSVLPLTTAVVLSLIAHASGIFSRFEWVGIFLVYGVLSMVVLCVIVALTLLSKAGRDILFQTFQSLRATFKA